MTSCPAQSKASDGSVETRKYRVLHVIDSLDLGGAQIVVLNLIKHGDRERFDFEVACLHSRGVFWDRLKELGVPVRTLSPHHYVPTYVPGLSWLYLTRGYDVVHTHLLASNVIAKPLAAWCGVPVRINHDHCNDKLTDPRPWALSADRITNRWSTHVVAVSESTRRFVVEHESVPESRATTIYNGIDVEVYQPRSERKGEARRKLGLPEDAVVVGGIGRLTYQKNFELFIDVAAEVVKRFPAVHFAIAGTGEEMEVRRKQAEERGLGDRLRFLGFVGDMPQLYTALDVLMLTSRYEGLPMTILEAMASGVPILSAGLDGVQEILRDGEDAALVEPGNREAFAERLGGIIERPEEARTRAAAALNKVRTSYSAQAVARSVEEIYLRYLEPRAGK